MWVIHSVYLKVGLPLTFSLVTLRTTEGRCNSLPTDDVPLLICRANTPDAYNGLLCEDFLLFPLFVQIVTILFQLRCRLPPLL